MCVMDAIQHRDLEVKHKDKNIADVLAMTVDEAIEFFGAAKRFRIN